MNADVDMDGTGRLPAAAPVAGPRIVMLDAEPAGTPETIYWHRPETLPDADLTVLVYLAGEDGGSSVECGWFDGSDWRLCESGGAVDEARVRGWADAQGPGW